MREQLCMLLALHAGETITKELAVAMVRELFPDRSYSPSRFQVQEYKGYVFQLERLAEIQDEVHPLHEAHYAETEIYRAGVPLNMDYARLKDRAHDGGLLQFTARTVAGELVGQMRVYLSISMHTKTLIATEDVFYVKPEHRQGFMAVRLWQYADRCAESIGVTETYFDSKLLNKADQLARYLKYTPIATKFAKVNPPKPAQECFLDLKESHVCT
jgi:hypothetical protein